MFTSLFWRAASERAVKTFAQTMVALLSVGGIGLHNAPWTTSLSAAGMAALLSLLTSIASERVGDRETPSLVRSDSAAGQAAPAIPALQPATTPAPQAAPATSVPA